MVNVNSNNFTVVFAAISCVIASVLLSASNLGLKDLQDSNVKTDKQRSVLLAAGLVDSNAPAEEVQAWFEPSDGKAAIAPFIIDQSSGKIVTDIELSTYNKKPEKFPGKSLVYECTKPGKESVILPIKGQGLWGPLYGYLALGKDGNSVLGICFYDHKETPGLGAEITEPWFMAQFQSDKGKKLLSKSGDYSKESFVGIKALKGIKVIDKPESEQSHLIDGISGATITSNGVSDVLTNTIYEQYSAYLKNRKS